VNPIALAFTPNGITAPFASIEHIAKHLALPLPLPLPLPVPVVNEALRFLLRAGLVVEENGKLRIGPGRTFVET
jgi:hypothetical protein